VRIVPWMEPLFRDRAAAGQVLAEAVSEARLAAPPVVVGVARGGVAVAVEVARALRVPAGSIDVERVDARGLRLGAASAEGPPYLLEAPDVPEHDRREALERAVRSARAMDERLAAPAVTLRGHAVLVVDDGAVTGLTLAAACRWAREQEPVQLVAATPVAHVRGLARIAAEADAVVCPHPLEELAVVGQAYDSFDPLDEWYVASLLADAAGTS
jgi:putative phosphoribosyl transferase